MTTYDWMAAAKTARDFVLKPCPDGKVITKNNELKVVDLLKEAGRPADVAKFAWYNDFNKRSEGLFAFDKGDPFDTANKKLDDGDFDTAAKPSSKKDCPRLLVAWADKPANEPRYVKELKPPHHGLNDCAHFVSSCLIAGKLLKTIITGVDALFAAIVKLGGRVIVQNMNRDDADRVFGSGILSPGDVCLFSDQDAKTQKITLHHSALLVGEADATVHDQRSHNVACHTFRYLGPVVNGEIGPSNNKHPLMTVVHFPFEDKYSTNSFSWNVSWRGQKYYYHFNNKGAAGYRKSQSMLPEDMYEDTGYWKMVGQDIVVCWMSTGSVEVFRTENGKLTGRWNGTENLEVEVL